MIFVSGSVAGAGGFEIKNPKGFLDFWGGVRKAYLFEPRMMEAAKEGRWGLHGVGQRPFPGKAAETGRAGPGGTHGILTISFRLMVVFGLKGLIRTRPQMNTCQSYNCLSGRSSICTAPATIFPGRQRPAPCMFSVPVPCSLPWLATTLRIFLFPRLGREREEVASKIEPLSSVLISGKGLGCTTTSFDV